MDRAAPYGSLRIGGRPKLPVPRLATPLFPGRGLGGVGESPFSRRGAIPPPPASIPDFPALGGDGRAMEIFIYFLYLFNFFFFLE